MTPPTHTPPWQPIDEQQSFPLNQWLQVGFDIGNEISPHDCPAKFHPMVDRWEDKAKHYINPTHWRPLTNPAASVGEEKATADHWKLRPMQIIESTQEGGEPCATHPTIKVSAAVPIASRNEATSRSPAVASNAAPENVPTVPGSGKDDRVAKTYVWHGGKCFFVSTIERDSSAMEGPRRYNETMVWEYDLEKRERSKNFIFQDGCSKGSIWLHQQVVVRLHQTGDPHEDQ